MYHLVDGECRTKITYKEDVVGVFAAEIIQEIDAEMINQ